jgi:hypothetical protein
MTPERLEKIIAIASDLRGNAHIRKVAAEMVVRARKEHPHLFPDIEKARRHPGLHVDPNHERFVYSDLEAWHKTASGNRTRVFSRGGKSYRLVIFKYKKAPRFGWLIINCDTDEQQFCTEKFMDMDLARRDAWNVLEMLR